MTCFLQKLPSQERRHPSIACWDTGLTTIHGHRREERIQRHPNPGLSEPGPNSLRTHTATPPSSLSPHHILAADSGSHCQWFGSWLLGSLAFELVVSNMLRQRGQAEQGCSTSVGSKAQREAARISSIAFTVTRPPSTPLLVKALLVPQAADGACSICPFGVCQGSGP